MQAQKQKTTKVKQKDYAQTKKLTYKNNAQRILNITASLTGKIRVFTRNNKTHWHKVKMPIPLHAKNTTTNLKIYYI